MSFCSFICFLLDTFTDTSPFASSPNTKSMWLGDVETSTDTLVPVIENGGPSLDDRICSELTTAINTVENGSFTDYTTSDSFGTAKQRILPEVHYSCTKPKPHMNGTSSTVVMDPSFENASIMPQPDHRKFDSSSGGQTNGVPVANGSLANRRNRDSNGAKLSPLCTDLPNSNLHGKTSDHSGSPPATNGKFSFAANGNASRSPAMERTINAATIPTMTTYVDGLAPALSEQNLRLLQIVQEHKVSPSRLHKTFTGGPALVNVTNAKSEC